jgi:hypothetical protein
MTTSHGGVFEGRNMVVRHRHRRDFEIMQPAAAKPVTDRSSPEAEAQAWSPTVA